VTGPATRELARRQPEEATGGLRCITRDPCEPSPPEFLAVCDDEPVDVVAWVHCPPECGGHPICAPCLELCRRVGGVR
jgi:hypothetical protein